ncbi:MAG: polyphosphate kinase 1, partial [Lawsonibacter sp.]|nr:polyphosphate kinase 1 [Lawsonibacter sp.]
KDSLLYYPYESMEPFLRLVKEASEDPAVLSIQITLYRIDTNSRLAAYLIEAAEKGKVVTVLMELRARFDEQNNIAWAERLEEAGCRILYGFDGMKVHSKICLITRREKNKLQYITQIGTGNYSEKTARLYSDFSLMTVSEEIGRDAMLFFKNMSIANLNGEYSTLLVAPGGFKRRILGLIDLEIQKALSGTPAQLLFKMNSLTDREIIDKLQAASQVGVRVILIVRGICCILPGVPTLTENISVTSVVGRFLEHARVYSFGEGEQAQVYLASADLMTRNTERRVEIACPVLDAELKRRVLHILQIQRSDHAKARMLLPDGNYGAAAPNGEKVLDCQQYFMDEATRNAGKPSVNRPPFLDRLLNKFR